MLLTALATCASFADADSWEKDPTTGCKLCWSDPCEGGFARGTSELSGFTEGDLYGRYEGAMKKRKLLGPQELLKYMIKNGG